MAEEDKAPQQPPAWLLAYPPFQRQDSLATQMVISDTKLQQCRRCIRFETMPPGSALVLGDPSCVPVNAIGSQSVIPSLMDYASQRPANILIPPAEKPSDDAVEEQQKGFWETSGKVEGPGAKTSANGWSDHTTWESSSSHTNLGSAGDLFESRQSIKHEGIDGVTRSASRDDALLVQSDVIRAQRMDQLAIAPNEDFRNKFPTIDALTVAKAEAEAKAEGAVADGKFGDEGDVFSGSGSVLGGEMVGKASAELSTKAATAAAEAIIGGHFAKGEVKSADDVLVHGKVGGEVASAEAKASGEVVLSPEEATLKGTLKAEALLGQIEGEGVIEITPKRVGNSAISAWNFVTRDDVATLGDEHDWGIKFTLGGSLSLGVQAEAEAEGTASASRVGAKAKAKVGLGIGAGVTAGAELKGLDKVWGSMKTAGIAVGDAASRGGRWVGGKAASGWSSIKQGWNSLWK
ncbi:hypothetical protein SAMN04488021_1752 [Paracoccus aminovorans]|uniref:Uncharacterized protein n=1 Tax=Paracoccus aminovorans TaxID=34004 RepID=A0A1I3FH55_9RHOB|nr:polymer-forming cytoskeletal protein [Paracoccus aminovorans]CQR86022.1 hypothetical protein JCM7685_1450 [Paracoccus aminovorans]SFI10553.1 hypothetical protein SAMN04488021_1752 [Paracoccus aminovorans]